MRFAPLLIVATSLTAGDYTWVKARENFGWGRTAYVLNLAVFGSRLWAFEGNTVRSSKNGVDWTLETSRPGWKGEVAHGNALVFNNRFWTLGGHYDEGRRLRNDVWSSNDGRNWKQITPAAGWPPRRGHATAVFRGKMWVLAGQGLNDIWSSSDGVGWTQVSSRAPWSPRDRSRVVAYRDRLWLIGGLDGERQLCDVWSSEDGKTWTEAVSCAEWGPRFVPSTVVFDSKLWLMGGVQKNDAWFSEDGIHWRRAVQNTGWFPRGGFGLAELDGKLWLLGGKTGVSSNSNPQDIWYMKVEPNP